MRFILLNPDAATSPAARCLLMILVTVSTPEPRSQAQNSLSPSVMDRRQQIEGLRTSNDIDSAVKHLIAIDADLSEAKSTAERELSTFVLTSLAEQATPAAMEHLRSVFETQTSRRHDAAYALSLAALRRPTDDQDWRYLVRSLTVVEAEQAVSVLQALQRFRLKATKSTWVREVILLGLQLPREDLPPALKLLEFWTGHTADKTTAPLEQLREYQNWFRARYPEQPAPTLPVDAQTAKWTFDKLSKTIADLPNAPETLDAGAVVYSKATCSKCHRREGSAEQPADDHLGPNLTSLGWRRQPKEVLSAILYPSHRLNDEYPVTTVLLQSGKSVSGLLMPGGDDRLKIVGADLKETMFGRDEIEETIVANVSNMPSGLLESLSEEEVRNLLAFLTVQFKGYAPHHR